MGRQQKKARNVWCEVDNAIGADTTDHDPEPQYFHVLLELNPAVERYKYFAYAVLVLERAALDLALSGKPPATVTAVTIAAVSRLPGMAFDFAPSHWDRFTPHIEPASQQEFIPRLISHAYDPTLIGKLDAFAEQHFPSGARQNVRKVQSTIRYTPTSVSSGCPRSWRIEDQSPPRFADCGRIELATIPSYSLLLDEARRNGLIAGRCDSADHAWIQAAERARYCNLIGETLH